MQSSSGCAITIHINLMIELDSLPTVLFIEVLQK